MGGRGASSGISASGKPYGTEYKTLLKAGNVLFVERADGKAATAPMETMTKGRVYVTVNNRGELRSISYYDKDNKRYKQVDLSHFHRVGNDLLKPHTHKGFLHNEKGDSELTQREKRMVTRVLKIWYTKNGAR